ncbi:MAG: ribonuclease P protein component [Oscillospiraceae bacterium]|nr:ribonuclease P protein component [Oscillospiraceae bacterium]
MLYTVSLKDSKVFSRLYKKGRFVADSSVVAYYMQNKLPVNRLGITAGKKLGNAVTRNRAKRILREAYRLNEMNYPIGYDIVLVAREGIKYKKTNELFGYFNRLAKEMNKAK